MERLRRVWRVLERYGPRLRDLVLIGVAGLETAGTLAAGPSGWFGERFGAWSVVVAGAVGTLALWWRRSRPVTVTVVALAVQLVAEVFAPLAFALLTLAVRRRDSMLAVMSLAAYAAFVIPSVANGGNVLPMLVSGPFVVGSFVAVGAYIGTRRDLLASLRFRAERAEAERELRAEQARLAERARIAQEMHDVLAHKVSLIALHAGGLEVNPAVGPEKVEESAGLIRQTARQAMEDLRQVLGVLRRDVSADGEDLAPVPDATGLERLLAASRDAGVTVHSTVDLPADLPQPLGRTVYRIVQEALTNVHKHARGAATDVVATGAAGQGVTVSVTNQRPVAAESLLPGSGAGLVGLRERVRLAGGTLTAGPAAGGGWWVEAWLPWDGGTT
ncbi:MAG TPA: histidine kinase [Kribbellaceae bacterium]